MSCNIRYINIKQIIKYTGGIIMKKTLKTIGAATLSVAMVASVIPGASVENAKAYTPGNYSYFNDYTLGYQGGVVAYVDGARKSLSQAGVKIYNKETDRPFKAEEQQPWDADVITLTQPVKYTTNDGKAHDVESMLTNFDFIADPTAIDNTEIDGKLYVYGTTEGFSYKGSNGTMTKNDYENHSLTILSSSDMVNWTDEGFMDSANLTNLPSYEEDNYVKGGFTSKQSWAPSGLKYDYDGDGKYTYYLFYTQGGSTGYVMSDSPTGPWKDPRGKALFDKSSPNCSDCDTCFDPAVLVDDKGDAYVYFGGLTRTSSRGCKVTFDKETGEVEPDGDPVNLNNYAHFEDNEINQFNGKYYYSYCTDFGSQSLTGTASIAVYVSDDPLNFGFDPTKRPKGQEKEPFTEDGIYRHFLGTVLNNPSTIYGESYNNHHHMQEFKGRKYIFYHSTVLNNTIHRESHQYRNLHVDEIQVDEATDNISCEPTYEGPEQIEDFNPYFNFDGSHKIINATTTSYSAGVKSTRDDWMVENSDNGSPMVLDEIDTGDWTKIQGVKFSSKPTKFTAAVSSQTDQGAIEVFVDDPTQASNLVASLPIKSTNGDEYEKLSTEINIPDIDKAHDLFFVFRGENYKVGSWIFDSPETVATPTPSATPEVKATTAPTAPTATNAPTATTAPSAAPSVVPSATPAPDTAKKASIKITGKKTVKVGKYITLKAKLTNVKGTVSWSVNKKKIATINKKGKLKGKKPGKVKVTAAVKKVKGSITITVKKR